MLRDFARKLYDHPGQTTRETAAVGHGSLTDVRLHLDQPIYGEVEGEPVTIIGQGNMVGASPVAFCIDGLGENAWLPTDRILITDPRFTPVGAPRRALTGQVVTR